MAVRSQRVMIHAMRSRLCQNNALCARKTENPIPEVHPANKGTPLDAKFLARQVVSVGIFRCADPKGRALRSPTVWASRNDDARDPEAEIHPRNAPGQRKHPRRSTPFSWPAKSLQWLAVRSQRVVHYDLRPCVRHETAMLALQKRNTIIIAAAQPMLGSESRVSSGETAQACTARYQGGP